MKMGGASYSGGDRIDSGSHDKDFRQTVAPIDGGNYSGHSGSTPSTPDFPQSKPPMGGSDWGNNCEPKIGDCK